MSSAAVSLARMVDLALGTPDVGAVNFNVLHSLLHAVLQRLNIADITADLPEETEERALTHNNGIDPVTDSKAVGQRDRIDMESDSGVTGLGSASEIGTDQDKYSSSDKNKSIPVTRTPYHSLEEKIERLERHIAQLGSLPSTKDLMDMVSASTDQQTSKVPRPVAEMWQSMQLSRKVDANTQGVSKVSLSDQLNDWLYSTGIIIVLVC